MDPLIARAFVSLLLRLEQERGVRKKELELPPGRYLQVNEIIRSFGLQTEPVAEEREANMKMLLETWRKANWLKYQVEEKEHDKKCAGITGTWCKCRTPQQEIHDWTDYAKAHWFEPLPSASKRRAANKFQETVENGTRRHNQKIQDEINGD